METVRSQGEPQGCVRCRQTVRVVSPVKPSEQGSLNVCFCCLGDRDRESVSSIIIARELRRTELCELPFSRPVSKSGGGVNRTQSGRLRFKWFKTEPRDNPLGGFPSAFNRGSPIEPLIETLSRVHTRTVSTHGGVHFSDVSLSLSHTHTHVCCIHEGGKHPTSVRV